MLQGFCTVPLGFLATIHQPGLCKSRLHQMEKWPGYLVCTVQKAAERSAAEGPRSSNSGKELN